MIELIAVLALIVFFLILLYFVPINLWITAIFSGVKLELMELVFMRIRKSPVKEIVNSMITSTKAGMPISSQELETHALAGGSPERVVKTLIKAKQKGIDVSFREVTSWDLAEWDLEEKLMEKANASSDDQLKISILNNVKTLSDKQLQEVKAFMDQLA